MKRLAGSTLCREGEKLAREVYTVDAKAGFSEKMRMPSLSAGRVQNPGTGREAEYLDEPACFAAITLWSEDGGVLEKILRIEIAFPPLRAARQKKTGSRYAPNTSSIAARISYKVQYARAASRM